MQVGVRGTGEKGGWEASARVMGNTAPHPPHCHPTRREFRDAARVMGNTALFQQMEAASQLIKRDVVFAASLYVA